MIKINIDLKSDLNTKSLNTSVRCTSIGHTTAGCAGIPYACTVLKMCKHLENRPVRS